MSDSDENVQAEQDGSKQASRMSKIKRVKFFKRNKSGDKVETEENFIPADNVIVAGDVEMAAESQTDQVGVEEHRDQWTNKIEYMLSVIGYVVDLGNCVRFPYVAYKNGGGAFLVPYFIFLLIIGIPMMYLEMSVGQFFRVGNITLWGKVNKFMKGIGISSLLVVCYITLYYATIISYSVYYLFASFRLEMPWARCGRPWNTDSCLDPFNKTSMSSTLSANRTPSSPAEEYFNRNMLGIHHSTGIENLGPIKLDLMICLAIVYFLMYVCICKGVKSTGKAVYGKFEQINSSNSIKYRLNHSSNCRATICHSISPSSTWADSRGLVERCDLLFKAVV